EAGSGAGPRARGPAPDPASPPGAAAVAAKPSRGDEMIRGQPAEPAYSGAGGWQYDVGQFFRRLSGGALAQQSGMTPDPSAPANAPGAGGAMMTPSEAGAAVGMAGGAVAGAGASLAGSIGQG